MSFSSKILSARNHLVFAVALLFGLFSLASRAQEAAPQSSQSGGGHYLKPGASSLEEEEAQLRDSEPARRRRAGESLDALWAAVESSRTNALDDLVVLLDSLKGRDTEARAVEQESHWHPLQRRSVGPYVVLHRQQAAINAIKTFAYEAGPLVPILIDGLKSEDIVLASASAAALGVMGRDAASALPDIKAAVDDKRVAVARNAVAALGDVSGSDLEVANLLVVILGRTTDDAMKRNVLISLGKQGKAAAAAVPTLKPLLYSSDNSGTYAAVSLAKIAPDDPETLEAFQKMLNHVSTVYRARAINGLSHLKRSPEVTKLLTNATKDTWPVNRDMARAALRLPAND